MDKDKVLSLAKLARIEVSDDEAENLSHEFEAILNYVGEVKNVTNIQHSNMLKSGGVLNVTNIQHSNILKSVGVLNVMREDVNPHESGLYTEKILEQAPTREGNYIKVKKILWPQKR